jgi:hypothetical protein
MKVWWMNNDSDIIFRKHGNKSNNKDGENKISNTNIILRCEVIWMNEFGGSKLNLSTPDLLYISSWMLID